MPIYEYICAACKQTFSWLVGVTQDDTRPACPHCGSRRHRKIISRVRRIRSEDAILDDFAQEDFGDLEDPKDARSFARRLGREFGEDLGDGFTDEVEAALSEESNEEDASEDE